MLAARRMMIAPVSMPTDFAFWWKADALSLTDGTAVSSWVDSSGNSLNAAQSTSSLRPIYHSAPSGFGGKPAVLFDGVDDMLTLAYTSTVNPSAMTLFAVFQAAALGVNTQMLQSETASTGYTLKINSTPSGHVHFYLHNGGALNGTDCGVISSTTTTYWACGTTTGSGTTANGYLDGTVVGAASAGALSPNTTDALNIGTFDGYIAEIIGYGRVLSDPERGAVDSYIKSKYGL